MFAPLFHVADPRHDLTGLQRQLDALLSDFTRPRRAASAPGPAFDLYDDGEHFRLVADLPGLRAEDLEVEATEDGLTLRGTRAVAVPEGFTAHHRERGELRLARSFTFPAKIDPEQVTASLHQGVLTITLVKRASAQPRTITVHTAAA